MKHLRTASKALGILLLLAAMSPSAHADGLPTTVPEIDPGSLSGGAALLAGGLLILTNRRRRK